MIRPQGHCSVIPLCKFLSVTFFKKENIFFLFKIPNDEEDVLIIFNNMTFPIIIKEEKYLKCV